MAGRSDRIHEWFILLGFFQTPGGGCGIFSSDRVTLRSKTEGDVVFSAAMVTLELPPNCIVRGVTVQEIFSSFPDILDLDV